MAWTWLIIAGLLEIVWAYFMKQSDGFTRLWPSVATLAFMGASFGLLALAMKSLPMVIPVTAPVGMDPTPWSC